MFPVSFQLLECRFSIRLPIPDLPVAQAGQEWQVDHPVAVPGVVGGGADFQAQLVVVLP